MANDLAFLSRRQVTAGLCAVAGVALLPVPSFALTDAQALTMVSKALKDVNAAVNSGKSQAALYSDFERIFVRYGDLPVIARSTLGPAARQASAGQMAAFTQAFQGYISRKYGRRFREFIGSVIEVTGARPVKSYVEVISVAKLRGSSPFELRWHVSDKSGKPLFFNIIIEGVNMLASESTEIRAMLDRRRGDINALIEDLKTA